MVSSARISSDLFTSRPLHPSSPRNRVRYSCLFLVPVGFLALLLFVTLFFPELVQRLHCALGDKDKCVAISAVSAFQAVMYNRYAIQRSCTPTKEGGKVVVVTGSSGFIGFATTLALKLRGDGVVGIDNFNDYYPVSLKKARAAELASAGVHTVHGDINDIHVLQQIFEAGVRYAATNPLSYIDSNVRGTTVLLEAVRIQRPMPLLVYASSSSIYGHNTEVPFTETDRVDSPASLYAATKRSCELLASVYNSIYDVSTTGLRFFTVYGPWGRPDMASLVFAHKITAGHPVKIFQTADGKELARDFTYIDDIVQGVLGALDTAAPGQDRLFNLGNTNPHTVNELVSGLEVALGKTAVRQYFDLPNLGEVLQTHSNISAAAAAFNYSPKVPLEEGLSYFAAWFYAYYGSDGSKLLKDEAENIMLVPQMNVATFVSTRSALDDLALVLASEEG